MTDAEIGMLVLSAYLAQHHFRLAQQHLEAAQRLALAASAPPPQPRPSAPQEQATPSISRRDYLDVASSYGYESAVDPDEGKFSPISPASSATSSFAATINDFGQMSLANALHPGLHAGRTRSAQGTTSVSPTPTEALSSRSVRSMRSIEREAALAGLSQSSPPHRPARPPRRATEGAVPATGPLETPGTLAPSLYGGGLLPSLADRIGSRSTRQAATDSPASSSSTSAHAGYSTVHSHDGAQPVPSAPAASDGDVLSVYRDDDDDSLAGDFFDAESVFSHVTNSPLPSYGDAAAPPPVPAIPAQYLSASMPTQDAGVQRLPQPSGYARTTSQDDFHGFRPRQAPHSYIIGANGQPIPVYATFPIPTAPAPLASAPITQNTIPSPSSAYAAAPIRPAIPPPPPVSLSQHPSTVSLSSSTLRAPSYASSEAGDRPHPGGSPSIRSTKSRMASLRAAVQRPHVRFMSPSPEAKSRAASDPGKGGKAAKKKGAGGGGSALKSGWDDDENESEEERERRKKAMSASLAMLL
ncbi:hypothetical protein Rhopal_007052-T1 [Rhodotorula paludigena]|uniref:Proteophosphoglycan ppg4 n=1 Tax=Rhodotorula paludigena TaxID=86838 RepID=A0AAV5GVK3_9BASI|nr:hypothetical protein Rhopal_007052-T1 [Rhodotorula paludigena]